MSKKLAVFDIDGTLFRWQLFHELIFELKNQNLFSSETTAKLEEAFIDWRGLKTGWHDYESHVIKAIEDHITDIKPEELELAAQNVVNRSGHKIYAYTANLAKELKSQDYYLLAVSGSQQEIAELFAKKHGFDECIGMVHQRSSAGAYTGEYERHVVGRKAEIITEFVTEHGFSLENSYGIGDSAGDIDMLALVDNPIAFNPASELEQAARQNGWPIVIERKNLAYRLEPDQNNQYILSGTTLL